jgi:superfamily II DNA helicase RecQ/CBS domain-containing protein
MDNPEEVLDKAVNRAAEITWWNRQMTKLLEVGGVNNAPEFVRNEIIERKGPFVEFVEAPKFYDESAEVFLESLGYDEDIIQAVRDELFGGDGSFYQHQAETMEAMARDENDNILAVPTATGKTEAFFLPMLNHCLQTDEAGLKGIILYPMKTLGVDQLNRFISYLDNINRRREPEERITIGIWDSDTPQRVGTRDYEIEEGSYIRGLESPRESGEKLRVLESMTVGTDNYQYSWIRVTRESIRNGVDILLTGPEALDHMFVSDNDETRGILGHDPNEHPVEHIVFDEAHVWSGIQGAAISLLAQRLKSFYSEQNPQVTMVSATVDNPTELASSLTRSPESEINTIGFTGRDFQIEGEPDFGRFSPCNVDEIALTLSIAHVGIVDVGTAREDFGLRDAIDTLEEIGLVSTDDELELGPATGEWISNPINRAMEAALESDDYNTIEDVIQTRAGRNRLTEAVLNASGTSTGWYEFIINQVPEVAEFADWFGEGTTGAVGFRHYDELLDLIDGPSVENPAKTLGTVMAFGRLAGVVTEKYHYFLKPPQSVYWCVDCERVTRNKRCPHCGDTLPEMQFCKRCHEPYVQVPEEEGEEDQYAPIRVGQPVDDCPGCGQWPRLTDIEVPTPTLLSYMLTEVCRVSPSKKTLAFSDSRSSAESVADQILSTEYGLMAETLYLQELIEQGGQAGNLDLFRSVSNRMRDEYWEPLIQNEFDEDGTAYNFLRGYLDEIENHAKLHNCEGLFDSALVTAGPVLDAETPTGVIIRHELFKLFAKNPTIGFQKNRIGFKGLTRDKLVDRLTTRSSVAREAISEQLDPALRDFLEQGIIIQQSWEEVRERVQRSRQDDDVKEELFEFLEAAREVLTEREIVKTAESGLLTRNIRRDQSELILLKETAFCSKCYRSYPVSPEGLTTDRCRHCDVAIETYTRFTEEEDGTLVATPGYSNVVSDWPYAIDHWAHDLTRPIRDGKEPDFITVGIHKGDTPHAVRGAIEEGFRRDDPEINIVSATPTMELGVDIGTLESVVQVGVPPTLTNYVQRSGRTGRTRGSSSLVLTAIRGNHPVDSHYYGNLKGFLDEFEPVRVPDADRFTELLAGHVVTETFAYLARNPHEENVFQRMYSLPEPKESLQVFVNDVEKRLNILRKFILEEREEPVIRYIRSIFGELGVEAFKEVFEGDGPLAIQNRVDNTFSRLVSMSSTAEANKNLAERNRRLDQWLRRLGYLANYRNFGQQFPVKFSGRTEGIEFESSGRLYDMYPGEENEIGAAIKLHGTNYLVSDVRGTAQSLTTVGICENEECGSPFRGYEPGTMVCPHCDEELTETPIHSISSVECKVAAGGQEGYSTRAMMSSFVDSPDLTVAANEERIFGLPCRIVYGEREVTDFVYAFERWHRAGQDKEVLRSEALIEVDESEEPVGQSWREQMEGVEQEVYRPIGQQYFTQGLTIRFDATDLRERFDQVTHDTATWSQALVSLEQAFKKAIATIIELDRDDFRVTTSFGDETIDLHIVDSRQGGNGISWQVQDRLAEVDSRVRDVAICDRCVDYCDECLLLSRTPAHYLDNDLLDRRMLAAIVGLDDDIRGTAGVSEPA